MMGRPADSGPEQLRIPKDLPRGEAMARRLSGDYTLPELFFFDADLARPCAYMYILQPEAAKVICGEGAAHLRHARR